MQEMTEGELVAALGAGDDGALSEAVKRHGGTVFEAARWLVRDVTLAEEVAQDAFVALWRSPSSVDLSRGTLKSFLVGVARHKAIDRMRSMTVRAGAHERANRTSDLRLDPAALDPSDQLSDRRILVDALRRLSLAQREALVLAYLGGRSYREVAEELRIPEGTAKSRLRGGLIAMRRLLAAAEVAV